MEVSLDALSGLSEELRQGILRAAAALKAAGARGTRRLNADARGPRGKTGRK